MANIKIISQQVCTAEFLLIMDINEIYKQFNLTHKDQSTNKYMYKYFTTRHGHK